MDQLDPELIKQVLALQSNQDDPQAIQLARQQQMANQLRTQSMTPAEGQMVGRRFVSPGALGAVRQMAQGYMANKQQGSIDQGMQGLSANRQQGKSAYLNALMNAMRKPQLGAPAPAAPMPGEPDLGTPQAGA